MDPVASQRDRRMRVEVLMVRTLKAAFRAFGMQDRSLSPVYLFCAATMESHSHSIHPCPQCIVTMTAVSKSGDTRIGLVGFPSVGSK